MFLQISRVREKQKDMGGRGWAEALSRLSHEVSGLKKSWHSKGSTVQAVQKELRSDATRAASENFKVYPCQDPKTDNEARKT